MDEFELKHKKMKIRQQHLDQKRKFGYGFPKLKDQLINQINLFEPLSNPLLAKYSTAQAFKRAQGNRKEDHDAPAVAFNNICERDLAPVLPLL